MQLIDLAFHNYSACIAKLYTQMERLSQRQMMTLSNAKVCYSVNIQMK